MMLRDLKPSRDCSKLSIGKQRFISGCFAKELTYFKFPLPLMFKVMIKVL